MWIRESKTMYVGKAQRAIQINSPGDAAAFMSYLKDFVEEHFIVLCLNNKNAVLTWREVSVGTISEFLVHPREVFRAAVEHSAAAVIVGHNHPSGDPKPSMEDIDTTKRLVEAGTILGIKLLDHIIIAHDEYVSMKEQGYI